MGNHRISLYEIEGADQLAFEYRLVRVQGLDRASLSNPDLADRNVNILAKLVAIQEKCPVAIVRDSDLLFIAVPADCQLRQLEYQLAPDIATLQLLQEIHRSRLLDAESRNRRIAAEFLRFCLRGPLWAHPDLWSSSPSTFFSKRPLNDREIGREIDLYEGFHFHLRYLDNKLFVGIKLAHKYIDATWAIDRFSLEEFKQLKMRMFLYHFGNRWFPIQLLEALDRPIQEARFVPDGTGQPVSVFDYTVERAGKNPPPWIRSLKPDSPAIRYRYPGRDQGLFGALGLAKLIHRTNDSCGKALHPRSIKSPEPRFALTGQVIADYFQGRRFFGGEIRVKTEPHGVRARLYPVPALEFGQGRVLKVGENVQNGETPLADLGRARLNALLDRRAGLAITSTLEPQYIVIPQTLDRMIATDATRRLEGVTRGFLHAPYRLDVVLYDDRGARTLKQYVDAIVAGVQHANIKHGRGVLILPANAHDDLHNYVKRALREQLHFQCLDAQKLSGFYRTVLRKGTKLVEVAPDLEHRFVSYLRYAALGLLIVNRQWGWVLRDGTHYDAYITFDVLNREGAFTFFYNGGRQCYTRPCDLKLPEKHERLSRQQVRKIVYEGLKSDLASTPKPKSLVLQRDGQLFRSEWLGFQDAINQLITEGLLDAGVVYGAIEIPKKRSAGLRLVEEQAGGLRNPRIGTACELGVAEGIVCTTGFPFSFRGTSSPLAVRIYEGHLDLDWVMDDVFRKSLLSLPAPDHCMRLPIDSKLCDEMLRAFAAEADEEEAVYGQEVEDAADVA
jgi:hypothetical protein